MRALVVAGCISMMGCTIIVNKQAAPSIAAPTATPERTPASSVKPAFDLNSTSDDVDQGSAYGQFADGVINIVGDSRPVVCPDGYILAGDDWSGAARFQQLRNGTWCRTHELTWGPPEVHIFLARPTPTPRPWSQDRMRFVKDLTEGTATKVVSVVVEPGQSVGGMVSYVVSAVDMSPGRRYQHQARAGHVSFTVTNDGGVESCAVTGDDRGENPTERNDGSSLVATDGVMGYAWATSTYPKNGCELTLTAWSSLQQTQFQIFAVTSAIYSGQSNAVWVDPRDEVTPKPARAVEIGDVLVLILFTLMGAASFGAVAVAVGIWLRSR